MLNVAVLCSKRAPGLDVLRAASGEVGFSPPAFGGLKPAAPPAFRVACVLSTEARPVFSPRRDYDAATLKILRAHGIDLVILLGYTYIVTDVLLSEFPILNIHDSDLRLTRPDGERRYVGLHSTHDAILASEKETRSTLHVVTEKLDGGPIIDVSRAYPVSPLIRRAVAAGDTDIVKACAYAQREWMMSDWGELLLGALMRAEAA